MMPLTMTETNPEIERAICAMIFIPYLSLQNCCKGIYAVMQHHSWFLLIFGQWIPTERKFRSVDQKFAILYNMGIVDNKEQT